MRRKVGGWVEVLPDEMELWDRFMPRLKGGLKTREVELWKFSGMEQECGPYSSLIGSFDVKQMIGELTVFPLGAILLDVEYQRDSERSGRPVGRPRDVMSRELGSDLLSYFLRHHNSAGRHSVAISIDGKQAEAAALFEFIKAAIEPVRCV